MACILGLFSCCASRPATLYEIAFQEEQNGRFKSAKKIYQRIIDEDRIKDDEEPTDDLANRIRHAAFQQDIYRSGPYIDVPIFEVPRARGSEVTEMVKARESVINAIFRLGVLLYRENEDKRMKHGGSSFTLPDVRTVTTLDITRFDVRALYGIDQNYYKNHELAMKYIEKASLLGLREANDFSRTKRRETEQLHKEILETENQLKVLFEREAKRRQDDKVKEEKRLAREKKLEASKREQEKSLARIREQEAIRRAEETRKKEQEKRQAIEREQQDASRRAREYASSTPTERDFHELEELLRRFQG